ncbi:hypothetical protein [Fibrella aquatica]|jgi:hypothetical protein|uniref:hypothetical protein n=1 Tax=Fibrella aquatica TaxID=3242487 RepID=UPI00351FB003
MQQIVYISRRLFLVPVIAGLLCSCAPKQYIRLQPISGPVASVDGRLVTKASADSVEIVASYEREDMEYMALDIEIKNHTTHAIDIDPADFQIELLDADRQPLQLSGTTNKRQAADPGYEFNRSEYKIKREEKRLKTAKIINTIALVAVVASDIASSSTSRNTRDFRSWVSNRATHNVAYNLIQAKRVIDHGVFADRMQRYQFEAYRWRELALKRMLVQPGESARGFVYLPKQTKAAFMNLSYPTASGTSIEVLFEQTLSKAKPK